LNVLTFDSATVADALLQTLKDLQADDFIGPLEAVIVTEDSKNKVEVRQPLDVGPGRGAAFGAASGAVIPPTRSVDDSQALRVRSIL